MRVFKVLKIGILVLFGVWCLGLGSLAFAQEKLKDVPDSHWAASAVYDLIKLGITKGYPDGTFRGNKPITRYETAIFLSKLVKALGTENIKPELENLRKEILEIKKESKKQPLLKGWYGGDWKIGNLLLAKDMDKGAVGSYRLVLSSYHQLYEGAEVKINLDTMDFGYFDDGSATQEGRGLLATDLLDIETKLKLSLGELPLELKLTYGPGPKQHQADPTGILPAEVGVTYLRPNPGLAAATDLGGTVLTLGYYALQGNDFNLTGKVNTGQLTGSISFNLPVFLRNLNLTLTGDYISQGLFSSSSRDVRAKVDLLLPLVERIEAKATLGAGGSSASEMMVSGALSLKDPLETGTVITLRGAKIGSSYFNPLFINEEYYFAGLDFFNRPLTAGTVQIGGVLTQNLSDKLRLVGKGDVRLSGAYRYEGEKARLTAEGGIYYDLAPNANLGAAYLIDKDRSTGTTSDLTQIGLRYYF